LNKMGFFNNSGVNRIYMHAGLQSFAFNAGGAFISVYLLKAGLALPLVLLTSAATILLRLPLRIGVVRVVKRIGLRNGLMLGTVVDASGFLLLAQVHDVSIWLVAYVLVSSLGTAFYWTCYHASMARLGDAENRGAQVSAREAIFAITGIVAPFCGGLFLTFLGPFAAFAATALINAAAALPLIGTDAMPIEPEVEISADAKFFAFGLAGSDGVVAAAVNFSWRIILFKTLGESFGNYGNTLAVAGLFGAIMGLGMGRLIDKGHHHRSVLIGLSVMVCTVLAEAFGYAHGWSAVAANMIGAVANPLYISAIMAPFYNLGKTSGCTLRFNAAGENGFDTGAGLGCSAIALLIWLGFSYEWPMLIGLVGCAGVYMMLRNRQSDGTRLEIT
jgi:MFS transporter, DHA1 family, inner membrane transport protein